MSLTWRTSGESPERRRFARDVTRAFDVGGEGGDAVADEVVGLCEDGQVDDGEVRVGVEDADLQWRKTIQNMATLSRADDHAGGSSHVQILKLLLDLSLERVLVGRHEHHVDARLPDDITQQPARHSSTSFFMAAL